MSLTESEKTRIKEKIAEALRRKGKTTFNCPICSHNGFTIVDGYVNLPLIDKITGNLIIGGPTLPNAVLICDNCGNTFFFNLGVWRLLDTNGAR